MQRSGLRSVLAAANAAASADAAFGTTGGAGTAGGRASGTTGDAVGGITDDAVGAVGAVGAGGTSSTGSTSSTSSTSGASGAGGFRAGGVSGGGDGRAEAEIVVAGEAGDGAEAVDLARRLLPDVLITDLVLPRIDGLAVTRAIAAAALPVRVLVLAGQDGDEHVLGAIAAGAAGFLRKDVPPGELIAAIRAVAAGGAVITPLVLARILARVAEALPAPETTTTSALDALTDREREVLIHVARGHSNGEIARALLVSDTTIKTHVGHLLTKLRLRDRTQAVVLAYETGLIKPGA
jgi:DNA-binding NarL/FixJ family response regulator